MNIHILEMLEGAREARGLAVVIDVFRAFSLEAYLMKNGAREIYAVGKEETARALKKAHPDYVLIGERGGVKLPGYDYGNSPSQTKYANVKNRCVIHTTSAGTQGLIATSHCPKVITGSLVNARAIADYIMKVQPDDVSLVAMGVAGRMSAPEDVLCARYIKSLLEDTAFDMKKEIDILEQTPSARKFFDIRQQSVFPKEDYDMCIAYDTLDLVLAVEKISEDIMRVSRV